MSQKRIFSALLIIFSAVMVAGCGNNGILSNGKNNEAEIFQKAGEKEDLLSPTGNVDDVLNAINSEANGEGEIVSKEEDDAKDAAFDKEEADNFGAIYDENEF